MGPVFLGGRREEGKGIYEPGFHPRRASDCGAGIAPDEGGAGEKVRECAAEEQEAGEQAEDVEEGEACAVAGGDCGGDGAAVRG